MSRAQRVSMLTHSVWKLVLYKHALAARLAGTFAGKEEHVAGLWTPSERASTRSGWRSAAKHAVPRINKNILAGAVLGRLNRRLCRATQGFATPQRAAHSAGRCITGQHCAHPQLHGIRQAHSQCPAYHAALHRAAPTTDEHSTNKSKGDIVCVLKNTHARADQHTGLRDSEIKSRYAARAAGW